MVVVGDKVACWCGNTHLKPFSETYLKCDSCETLVLARVMPEETFRGVDDEKDFYGRKYYDDHLTKVHGYPPLEERARADLPERCLYWLRTLLRYKPTGSKLLELGSGHGGFVALSRWAGYDGTGLELSPWLVKYAKTTFGIPMLQGTVEHQELKRSSIDAVAMMDVLEHLPDPLGTMEHCSRLLRPDGIALIQTPRYPEQTTYEQLLAREDRFLEQLKENEHIYLFSQTSITLLLERAGLATVSFEEALFSHYDMFIATSAKPLKMRSREDVEEDLSKTAGGRMILALVDLDEMRRGLEPALAERNTLRAELSDVRAQLASVDLDRAARLKVIEGQGVRMGEVEAERNNLQSALRELQHHFELAESDRARRLEVIESQGKEVGDLRLHRDELQSRLAVSEDRRAKHELTVQLQQEQMAILMAQLRSVQQLFVKFQKGHIYRVLSWFGVMRWMGKELHDSLAATSSEQSIGKGVRNGQPQG